MAEIFEQLESNDKETVENAKQKLRDQFKTVSDPWLIYGLYDHYLYTNSVCLMDILVNIKEPHHNYLFEKMCESIKASKVEVKVQALTLLGHIARSQPPWLYKLPEHNLQKEILKLLKNEVELLPLISALLVLIVLLPMIPSSMGEYLRDLFEIFSRLASWNNCDTEKIVEDQMIHMQVALYALFLRLYGMYPCNFLAYLRSQYREKHDPVFVHTIQPMLDTVRMHPALVTASKDNETTTERWKRMDVHDVIVECERFSLDLTDRCPHDTCQLSSGFRSRSGTTNSTIEPSYHLQSLKNLVAVIPSSENTSFTPNRTFHVQTPPFNESVPTNIPHVQGVQSSSFPSQEGTSPPEAAIEATPETTPIRDIRLTPTRPPQLNSNLARALTSFSNKNSSLNTTPTHSQPSSPMRKDNNKFVFDNRQASAFNVPKRDSSSNQKIQRMLQDRNQIQDSVPEPPAKRVLPPTSPLRILNPSEIRHSPVQRMESPISQEDKEVGEIVKNDLFKQPFSRQCDSVLHEYGDGPDTSDDQLEHGSPCTAGGLHMPNSSSMIFVANRMRRLRYHSQCNPEPEELSTGSSPGKCVTFPTNTVRRANSCPEIKKSPPLPTKDNTIKPFIETDEESVSDHHNEYAVNNNTDADDVQSKFMKQMKSVSCETQTDNFWPMPYEHLFLSIFPSLESNDVKPSPAPSPALFNLSQEKYFPPSIYEILDKFVEKAGSYGEKDSIQFLKNQLQLLHLQLLFERHRRETHAYRNRRLLSDVKNSRLLEEYNSALRDQVQLQQKEIDNLRSQLEAFKKERLDEDSKLLSTVQYWESKCKSLQQDCNSLKDSNEALEKDLAQVKDKCSALDSKRQDAESALLDAIAEGNVARELARAGEKGRTELEQVNKELLLIGELQLKYEERLSDLSSMKKYEQELEYIKEVSNNEIISLKQQLESKLVTLEAYKSRITELEHTLLLTEETISAHKRIINGSNEEHNGKLEAVESKYQTQLIINRALEEKILDLRQRLEVSSLRRSVHSPDTSSCHEVQVTTTAGLSPHSSPLSESLASSEGSIAFHDVREVKNLQAFVDQKEPNITAKPSEEYEMSSEHDMQQSSSSKHD